MPPEGAQTLVDMRLLAAQAVAREAGAMARRRFLDRSFTVGFKARQDYLTEVDGETEAFIAERLLQVFPSDGFIGEESKGRPAGEGGASWVVDPIDGTANFARGVPHFCVSVASVADGGVEVGVIYDPMRDELFSGRRGGGARLNGAPMRASGASALANFRDRGRLEPALEPRSIRRPRAAGRRDGRRAVSHRLRRARPRLCRGRPSRRLCRTSHPCVGLSRRDPAGERSGRVCERLSARGRARQGRPAHRLRVRGEGRPHRRRGFRGCAGMTEITLSTWRSARDDRASRRRGAQLADRRARSALARRSGDLERHQSDPLSGRRLDARRRGAGRRRHLQARPARLRQVRDLRRRKLRAGLRAPYAQRQCAHPRGLSLRLRACDRIPADATTRSRSPSKSPIPGISARLTPAGCTPVSAGPSARPAAPALSFSSRRTSGPRFRNSRPAASSARPRG